MSKNWSAKYYQKNNERVQKRACERNKVFPKKKKEKKQDYGQKQYQNLFEDDKEKLIGYRKNYLKGLQITGTYNSFLLLFSVA